MAVATKTPPQTGTQTQQPTAAYFREQFKRHPEWLKQSDNGPIIEQYRRDRGEQTRAEMKKITANLSNLKSLLRAQAKGKRRQRGGSGTQQQGAKPFDGYQAAGQLPGIPPTKPGSVQALIPGATLDEMRQAPEGLLVSFWPAGMELTKKQYVQGKQVG